MIYYLIAIHCMMDLHPLLQTKIKCQESIPCARLAVQEVSGTRVQEVGRSCSQSISISILLYVLMFVPRIRGKYKVC